MSCAAPTLMPGEDFDDFAVLNAKNPALSHFPSPRLEDVDLIVDHIRNLSERNDLGDRLILYASETQCLLGKDLAGFFSPKTWVEQNIIHVFATSIVKRRKERTFEIIPLSTFQPLKLDELLMVSTCDQYSACHNPRRNTRQPTIYTSMCR